ncbi:MAG: 50S ribosomal protein L9 [Pseudomonadota bacterium]|jgi:large subunit ribosomal protein L9
MEVILREDYISLGYIGDTVRVRRGFARNFLIPRGIAVEATSGNESQLKHKLSAIVAKRIKKKAEAEAFAKVLGQVTVEFTLKVGASGKSFGAVTSRDVEASLKALGYEVDRRQIRINETIKSPGVYAVDVKLHSEVTVPVQVKVIAAQPPASSSEGKAEKGKKKSRKKGDELEATSSEEGSEAAGDEVEADESEADAE